MQIEKPYSWSGTSRRCTSALQFLMSLLLWEHFLFEIFPNTDKSGVTLTAERGTKENLEPLLLYSIQGHVKEHMQFEKSIKSFLLCYTAETSTTL